MVCLLLNRDIPFIPQQNTPSLKNNKILKLFIKNSTSMFLIMICLGRAASLFSFDTKYETASMNAKERLMERK